MSATTKVSTKYQRERAVVRALDMFPAGQAFHLNGLTWKEYKRFDKCREELDRRFRINYFRGELELHTNQFGHQRNSARMHMAVGAICMGTNTHFNCGGSTTLLRDDLECAVEPDQCYFIRNWKAAIGIRDLDLQIHPPPDLVIEVERQGTFSKQAAYEAIGVPELWWVNDESIRFLVRSSSGAYVERATSLAFPMVDSVELSQVYFATDWNDDITLMDATRVWASKL